MRLGRLVGWTALLGLAVAGGSLDAVEAPGIEARVVLDREEATVGERIGLTLEVTHPAEITIHSPTPVLEKGSSLNVEALGRLPLEREEDESSSRPALSRFGFVVQVFETGEVELPGFRIQWSGAEGEEGDLSTEPLSFSIRSVLEDSEAELADLKPPVSLPAPPIPWRKVAAAGLVLLFGALLFYLWRRGGKGIPAVEGKMKPGVPPHEQAYRELEELLASGMLKAGKLKEFHVALVEIVKRYLEGRFQIEVMESTTPESLNELKRVRLAAASLTLTREIFVESDLVKFAKWRPAEVEVRETVERVYRLVDQTKWVPPPASPTAPSSSGLSSEPTP